MAIGAFEPHPLVRLLGMPAADFAAGDLVRAVEELGLSQVNLRYVGGDGRLKTVAFPINSRGHLHEVLTRGERVGGSSVFAGMDTESSDVYIIPRHRTAFINPFGERDSLDVLCSFYREDGTPLPHAREQVVRRAAESLEQEHGVTIEAFGELEYYLVDEPEQIYPVEEERGYQESAPFSKHRRVREQVLGHLCAMGVPLKYAHGEVGNILEADRQLVQHEIELQPVPLEQAADHIAMTKWVVREVAYAHGLEATFAPSVSGEGAGNGLHIHSRLVRDGTNMIAGGGGGDDGDGGDAGQDDDDKINDTGRRLIAGYLSAAQALTAFGNTVPTSYLRFTEGEESPEDICWGMGDRTGLVRVPLAWGGDVLADMIAHANPGSTEPIPEPATHHQTVELRLGDGSADVHLLLAGMAVAAKRGLSDPESLERAERLRTDGSDDVEQLPTSCAESADVLEAEREMFEADGVFPASLIDALLAGIREAHDALPDGDLAADEDARAELIRRYWHVGGTLLSAPPGPSRSLGPRGPGGAIIRSDTGTRLYGRTARRGWLAPGSATQPPTKTSEVDDVSLTSDVFVCGCRVAAAAAADVAHRGARVRFGVRVRTARRGGSGSADDQPPPRKAHLRGPSDAGAARQVGLLLVHGPRRHLDPLTGDGVPRLVERLG